MSILKRYNSSTGQWEAAFVGASGNPGVVTSATPPTTLDSIWIDTTDNAQAVSTTGGSTITASSSSVIPLRIKGAVSHSANYLEVQNSAGNSIVSANPAGYLMVSSNVPGVRVQRFTDVAAAGSFIELEKYNTLTHGGQGLVTNGALMGRVSFYGSDGTQRINSANIGAEVDGTPGLNDMPGRLVFSTTGDGQNYTTERMRIDSAGRITTTSQPFFYVKGSAVNVTTTAGMDLPFNTAIHNRNSVFNTSNYRFTAPVAGVYYINFSLFNNGGSNSRLAIKVNGANYNDSQNAFAASPTHFVTWSAAIYLNANDYVTVGDWQSYTGATIYMGHSHFSGYLLG